MQVVLFIIGYFIMGFAICIPMQLIWDWVEDVSDLIITMIFWPLLAVFIPIYYIGKNLLALLHKITDD